MNKELIAKLAKGGLSALHVIPVNDGHGDEAVFHEGSAKCWCNPKCKNLDRPDETVPIFGHNSFDGRESEEKKGIIREGNGWIVLAEYSDEFYSRIKQSVRYATDKKNKKK